ncbi:MAG: hypothetical protein ACK5LT_00620 [Lachnospirales bacterium]
MRNRIFVLILLVLLTAGFCIPVLANYEKKANSSLEEYADMYGEYKDIYGVE